MLTCGVKCHKSKWLNREIYVCVYTYIHIERGREREEQGKC